VHWLLQRVWPTVLEGRPDATLLVVGRAPSEDLRRRLSQSPRTQLAADVPDVAPFLAAAHVAVNPAVSGSGVNIKLVEYLAAGVPMVSTSHATAGLPLRPGVDLLVNDDPDGFAHAIVALLADPERGAAMATSGREMLRRLVDPAANLRRIQRLMVGGVS
jgi:glycosyltransferase involved in cell wall biosynthesis